MKKLLTLSLLAISLSQFKKGKYNGQGVFAENTGDKFNGEWKLGIKNGKGQLTLANGDKYNERWENGELISSQPI